MKFLITMDPVQPIEIFKMSELGVSKIKSNILPQDCLTFLQQEAQDRNEFIDVDFVGPPTYVQHFITQANQIPHVYAYYG